VLRPEGIMTRTFLELIFRWVPQKALQNPGQNPPNNIGGV